MACLLSALQYHGLTTEVPYDLTGYKEKDRQSLISLWQRIFPDDPPHNDPAKVISAKLTVDDLIFVAEKNNQVVGAYMAGYDGHRGWLYTVAVSPELRRSGTGTLLVNTAIQELKRIGCVKINLQIRSTNTSVAAFIGVFNRRSAQHGEFAGIKCAPFAIAAGLSAAQIVQSLAH